LGFAALAKNAIRQQRYIWLRNVAALSQYLQLAERSPLPRCVRTVLQDHPRSLECAVTADRTDRPTVLFNRTPHPARSQRVGTQELEGTGGVSGACPLGGRVTIGRILTREAK
jgi:hypothetical protein